MPLFWFVLCFTHVFVLRIKRTIGGTKPQAHDKKPSERTERHRHSHRTHSQATLEVLPEEVLSTGQQKVTEVRGGSDDAEKFPAAEKIARTFLNHAGESLNTILRDDLQGDNFSAIETTTRDWCKHLEARLLSRDGSWGYIYSLRCDDPRKEVILKMGADGDKEQHLTRAADEATQKLGVPSLMAPGLSAETSEHLQKLQPTWMLLRKAEHGDLVQFLFDVMSESVSQKGEKTWVASCADGEFSKLPPIQDGLKKPLVRMGLTKTFFGQLFAGLSREVEALEDARLRNGDLENAQNILVFSVGADAKAEFHVRIADWGLGEKNDSQAKVTGQDRQAISHLLQRMLRGGWLLRNKIISRFVEIIIRRNEEINRGLIMGNTLLLRTMCQCPASERQKIIEVMKDWKEGARTVENVADAIQAAECT